MNAPSPILNRISLDTTSERGRVFRALRVSAVAHGLIRVQSTQRHQVQSRNHSLRAWYRRRVNLEPQIKRMVFRLLTSGSASIAG